MGCLGNPEAPGATTHPLKGMISIVDAALPSFFIASNHTNMKITEAVQQKILVLDGAMGTMIQAYKFQEEDYRGNRFASYPHSLKGNNDLLVLTQSEAIDAIHLAYLEAGADILETNTFNSNSISMEDYHMSDLVVELNKAAVESARRAIDQYRVKGGTEAKYIAGSVGPTNKTASLSPDVNNPGFRAVSFFDFASVISSNVKRSLRRVWMRC